MADYVLHDKFYLSSDMINVLLIVRELLKLGLKNANPFSKYNMNNVSPNRLQDNTM